MLQIEVLDGLGKIEQTVERELLAGNWTCFPAVRGVQGPEVEDLVGKHVPLLKSGEQCTELFGIGWIDGETSIGQPLITIAATDQRDASALGGRTPDKLAGQARCVAQHQPLAARPGLGVRQRHGLPLGSQKPVVIRSQPLDRLGRRCVQSTFFRRMALQHSAGLDPVALGFKGIGRKGNAPGLSSTAQGLPLGRHTTRPERAGSGQHQGQIGVRLLRLAGGRQHHQRLAGIVLPCQGAQSLTRPGLDQDRARLLQQHPQTS